AGVGIHQARVGDAVLLCEGLGGVGLVIDVDADEGDVIALVLLPGGFQILRLDAAGTASRVPEVDDRDIAADLVPGEVLAVFGDTTERDRLTALVGRDLHDPEVLGRVGLLVAVQIRLGGGVGRARAQTEGERTGKCRSPDAQGSTATTDGRGHAGNRTRGSYGCSGTVGGLSDHRAEGCPASAPL